MKKIAIIIPIIFLVACSNKKSNIQTNIENEIKAENAIEILEETKFNKENKPVLEKTKTDNDLFTFDRPIFTNPTGTKWEITATTSCTIDLNEYPLWVKNNIDYLLEINNDSKKQTLNELIDLKENYIKYPNVNCDLTEDKVWGRDGIYSQKAVLYYAKGVNYAGEVKVLNKDFLNSIAYTDGYLCNDINNPNINYTFKEKIVYFKDIKKYDTMGFVYYLPEINEYYANDINNYFICDLENNGKAYFCKLNMNYLDYSHPCWAELDYNCMIEIMCVAPFMSYEKIYLNCDKGYFHRIETYEELQNWAYLYSSIYDKYVDISKVPNPNEKSSYNPYVTNSEYALQTSNNSHCYSHINGGGVKGVAYCEDVKPGLYEKEFLYCGFIRKENANQYLLDIVDIFNFGWGENSIIYKGDISDVGSEVLQFKDMGTADVNIGDFEKDSYRNETLELLDYFGIHRHQYSVNDYGNEDIIYEVVNYFETYVKNKSRGNKNMYNLHVYPENRVIIEK